MKTNTTANPQESVARKKFILTEETPFLAKEAYKGLRTNVMFSLPGNDCKCVGITSASPSEGKSTTAINLAISLSQIGKRVLLIDGDMRIPSIGGRMQIKANPGLSDFLVGEARIDDAVRNVAEYGIHVLPAGSLPPDPTGLLESRQFEHLITALRKIYDYVIIDLPPVNSVSDALILTKYIDGYLLAVREKRTKHRDVAEALKQLKFASANIVGFVATGSLRAREKYSRKK